MKEFKPGDLVLSNSGYYYVVVDSPVSYSYSAPNINVCNRRGQSWSGWLSVQDIKRVVPKGTIEYALNYFDVETKEVK